MKKIRLIIIAVAVILLSAVLISGAAERRNIFTQGISHKELLVQQQLTDSSIYYCNKKTKDLKKIASSGVLEMYLDEETLCVFIKDTISSKLWQSLPTEYKGEATGNLKAEVLISGRSYVLDSQRDSLKEKAAEYTLTDKGVIISYGFRKSLENGKEISFMVPLELSLEDGMLSCSVSCGDITDNSRETVSILALEVLPFFGSSTEGEKGDYILLPSASGVILDLYDKDSTFSEAQLKVYGEDLSKNCHTEASVPLGAFGMKNGDSSFVCLMDKGEALGSIKAQKAKENEGCNAVGAVFEITPWLLEKDTYYVSRDSYEGELRLCYRFLTGNNCDYISMAGALREMLIRHGSLTDGNIDTSGAYPFNLSLLCYDSQGSCTTSEHQATELLTALVSKGITGINVLMENLPGEYEITSPGEDIALFMASPLYSYGDKNALTLSGDKISQGVSLNGVDKSLRETVYDLRDRGMKPCVTDFGAFLPTSRDGDFRLRSDAEEKIASVASALSAAGEMTVYSGNLYAVKYASNIVNIPLESPLEEYDCCRSVPFLQAVLHGICDYSFTAVNTAEDPAEAMLKAIEYGALPHYQWYFVSREEADPLYYGNSLSQAKLLYDNMKAMLSDLRDQRITAHTREQENVFRTQYSSGSEIYVNYNSEAVTVNGISIDPMGFVRVN